ncbi:MAG: tetratricopeptide repeat protein [Bacteroidota bacterium]
MLLILFIGLNLVAQDSIISFDLGNTAYKEGNYTEAINHYEDLIEDYQSPDLFKNLGNAYFRQNELGKAILFYEKALKINPSDEDALFNLAYANNLTVDRLGEEGDDRLKTFFRGIVGSTAANNWAFLSIIMAFLFFGCLVLMILKKNIRIKRILFLASAGIALLFLISVVFAYQSKQMATKHSHAIITDQKVDVRSEPNSESKELFVLHEGAKVELLESSKEWIEIMLPNGSKGWLEKSNLAEI